MPVVLRYKGFFYSSEGIPREPMHVHVGAGGCEAKFWLRPSVRLAVNAGFNLRQVREFKAVVEWNRARIEEAWREHFA
jgi:hypothetical protein